MIFHGKLLTRGYHKHPQTIHLGTPTWTTEAPSVLGANGTMDPCEAIGSSHIQSQSTTHLWLVNLPFSTNEKFQCRFFHRNKLLLTQQNFTHFTRAKWPSSPILGFKKPTENSTTGDVPHQCQRLLAVPGIPRLTGRAPSPTAPAPCPARDTMIYSDIYCNDIE